MRWQARLLFILVLALSGCQALRNEASKAGALDICLTTEPSPARRINAMDSFTNLYVTLANVSRRPVTVWQEWSAWGYSTLSFDIFSNAAPVHVERRQPAEWRRNFPAKYTLEPGSNLVFAVGLASNGWVGLPQAMLAHDVMIRAIYEIHGTKWTAQHGVWTGRVVSSVETMTLDRVPEVEHGTGR